MTVLLQGEAPVGGQSSDTTRALEGISHAVDRVTEVRSWSDVWELAGVFQVQLLGLAGRLLMALAVLVVFAGLYLLLRAALGTLFRRAKLEQDAADLMLTTLKIVVIGFAAIAALDQLRFEVTTLLAGLGVAGLALGFAAKDTLANFIAGVTILWDRPFRVGDRVEIDGEFGQVKKVTLRSTRIHTNQNRVVIIPNQNVVNNKIVNHTMQASLRLDIPFGIAYKDDIERAREVVLAVAQGDERLRARPPVEVVVSELADSAVVCALRMWLKNPHLEIPLAFEYREKIKRALDEAGITIPYPHLSLYVEQPPASGAATPAPGAPGPGPEPRE